jgi:hypothetical protein
MERCINIYESNIAQLAKHNFDKTPFFKLEGEIVDSGFDAQPASEYELPKKFPNCCIWHTSLLTNHFEWFNRFPNCCKWHQEIGQKTWFKKENFYGLPLKIVRNIIFTTHHIDEQAHKEHGLEDIIHYIEYILESFGSPGIGANLYVSNLKHYLKHTKSSLTKVNKDAVLTYLKQQQSSEALSSVDPNLVHEVFQKWLRAIPDLSIFSAFKQSYSGKVAANFLFYNAQYNPYLNQTKFRIRTRKELTKYLLDFTKEALANVDSILMLENGTISDVAKHQLDIAGSKRKLKQETLLGKHSKGELKYLEVMQRWLITEEEYFTEVFSLLGNSNVLPHVKRPNKLETGANAPNIQNNISMGDNAKVYLAQGNNASQTNSSEGAVPTDRTST